MIKKTQIRFIYTTMIILLCVFAVIFLGTIRILGLLNVSHIDNVLTNDANEIDPFELDTYKNYRDGQIIVVGSTAVYDSDRYTKSQMLLIYETASERKIVFGNFDNVYYKFFDRNGIKMFVASDFTNDINELKSNRLSILLILGIIYGVLFFLVYILSFRVIRPIKDTFNRQNQFISDASHELKTPLTIISANADVLAQTEQDDQWIESIKQQTKRMQELVSDMLLLAKMDEKTLKLSKERFNLSEEIFSTTLTFDALAFEKEKQLDYRISQDIFITGDRSSIAKVSSILIDNAIKYANSKIFVSLYQLNEKTFLEVYNDGSHIPNRDSNKIFERFYRGDNSRSRESGGSGLGLAIAKGICDANKWKISAKSEYEKSMTITVIIG